jgi:hypothetical protein
MYMHNAACQLINSIFRTEGAGRGSGEPPEIAWSLLSKYGSALQYTGAARWHDKVEFILLDYNLAKGRSVAQMLQNNMVRSLSARDEALKTIAEVKAGAAAEGVHLVGERGARHLTPTPERPLMTTEMIYVLTILRMEKAKKLANGSPGVALLMGDKNMWKAYRATVGAADGVRQLEVTPPNTLTPPYVGSTALHVRP